jgi:Cof subfamily protein (haloacid dehalogenase superfamily)
MIKLISLDMDGTLLDNQGNLPNGNIASIQAAKEKGIHIILNTGKPISAIIDEYHALELDDPVITMTGGLLLSKNGNENWKILKGNPIPETSFSAIYQAIQNIRITTHFMNENMMYVYHAQEEPEHIQQFVDAMQKFSCLEYSVVEISPLLDWTKLDMPVYKIMFYSPDSVDCEHVWSALNEAKIPGLVTEFSSPHTVDVHTIDSGKKNAVDYLCKLYHISREEVMALGDHESDM